MLFQDNKILPMLFRRIFLSSEDLTTLLGPGVGAWLYEMGGFMLPFLVVGAISIILSLTLIVTIPDLGPPEEEEEVLIQDPTEVQLRYVIPH